MKLDRDWWRAQGIEACLDRMQLMGDRLAAPVSVPSSTAIVPPSWVAFSKAAGETSEGVMRRALGDIASISPLSTAAPQEIARNALIAAEALATPVSAIGRAPKWLVQAGGERYDTWLCATREDVRKAFCEALFGDVESATAAEIDGYMEEFDRSGAEQESKHPSQTWRFEDGWLGFITLSPAHDDIGHTR